MFYGQDIDNEPPEDPIYEEAQIYTDLQLEAIQDDLDDDAYQKQWQKTYEAELARLKQQRQIEIEHYAQLTPLQKREWDEWGGIKPPTDEDDLLDDGVYEGDTVIHQPYDDDED